MHVSYKQNYPDYMYLQCHVWSLVGSVEYYIGEYVITGNLQGGSYFKVYSTLLINGTGQYKMYGKL